MASNELPIVRIQNTGPAQSNVPFTFGHVFAVGHLAPTDGLVGGTMPLQIDVKATHADGSVRHAILSGVLPALPAGETAVLQLAKSIPAEPGIPDPNVLKQLANLDAKVSLAIGGETYAASVKGAKLKDLLTWLFGPVVIEGQFSLPLKNAAGAEHRLLQARFGVRYYPGSNTARIEFIVENAKTFTSAQKFTYDVDAILNGKSVYSRKGLDHYHHSRWHVYAWTGDAPQINIQFDPAYLIQTRAVPNYDMKWAPREGELAALYKSIGGTNPMDIGPVTREMGMTGARNDIGSLPTWAVMWVLSQDKRARDVMMAAADGSGSWSVHYRDESTGLPVRTDNDKNKDITLHFNLRDRGPLPVPRYLNDDLSHSWNPYLDDTAHQPSLVFLPYLITGDRYYLEELQFWAVDNALGTDPSNSGHGQGLVRWLQLRGQAWSMRTLGHVAYITPDDDPMKDYFVKQLDNNLTFYHVIYAKGQPNKLGAYDGSGEGAFNEVDGGNFAFFQDDFLTAEIGYIGNLGFDKAAQIAKWKAQYVVLRMTSPDFPWWLASSPAIKIRLSKDKPLYEGMREIYVASYGNDLIPNDDGQMRSGILNGKKFIDMPFYGTEQAQVLGNINGYGWEYGRMVGYADASMGYPANMQPALAAAVNTGILNADRGWATFIGRACQPDSHSAPQWAILPYSAENIMPAPIAAPAPAAPAAPSKALKIGAQPGGKGTWAKIAAEGEHVKPAKDAYVRYGINDKFVYAQVSGEFDATNVAFGIDPAPQIVKKVEVFTVAKLAKIKTPSNTLLKKKTGLLVKVIDAHTLQVVATLKDAVGSSTGVLTLSDTSMLAKQVYAVSVEDAKGNVLDIMYPVTATAA